jgi:hypothetical protein
MVSVLYSNRETVPKGNTLPQTSLDEVFMWRPVLKTIQFSALTVFLQTDWFPFSCRHTNVPYCVRRPRAGKLTRCRARNNGGSFRRNVFEEAEHYEYGASTKNGPLGLHRKVDTQDFVFS